MLAGHLSRQYAHARSAPSRHQRPVRPDHEDGRPLRSDARPRCPNARRAAPGTLTRAASTTVRSAVSRRCIVGNASGRDHAPAAQENRRRVRPLSPTFAENVWAAPKERVLTPRSQRAVRPSPAARPHAVPGGRRVASRSSLMRVIAGMWGAFGGCNGARPLRDCHSSPCCTRCACCFSSHQ